MKLMSADPLTAATPAARRNNNTAHLSLLTRAKFAFARGFLLAFARCFTLRGLYLFGQIFGTCEWLLNYNRRRRFREHMQIVFGRDLGGVDPRKARWAAWRQFVRTRCDKLIYTIFDLLPREWIQKRISFRDRHILDDALARGKGAYLAMSHNGPHHVSILLMAFMRYRLAGVRDPKEGANRRYMQARFEQNFPEYRDIRMIYSNSFPRDIYRCFQDGYVLGSALDISRRRGEHLRTIKVNVLGQDREFLIGPIQIALRCGAPILQPFVLSKPNFHFEILMHGPLADSETAKDTPEVVESIIQRYGDNVARHLAEHPDQLSRT